MINKRIAAILAACMIIVGTAGCNKRDELPTPVLVEDEASVGESSATGGNATAVDPGSMTSQQVAEYNAQITDEDYNLVQFENAIEGDVIAVMETSEGTIRIRLFPQIAPRTVENFIALAEEGYYNGITFHRVIEDYMIQTGDPTGTGKGGESSFSTEAGDPGYFDDEFSLDLWNFRGALSMANGDIPNSNSSQFFIVQRDFVDDASLEQMKQINFPAGVVEKYQEVGGVPNFDWKHTVFGMVIEGLDVVDDIAGVKTDEDDKPKEPVIIEKITIEK